MSASPGDGDAFLSRWSRRKRGAAPAAPEPAAREAPSLPEGPVPPEVAPSDLPARADALPDAPGPTATPAGTTLPAAPDGEAAPPRAPGAAPGLTDADMPPLESLSGTSDVSAFLDRGVSAALRRAALRRVFGAPEFNVRDGLNDYDADFTRFEPLGDTITCDMKFHAARRAREAAEREAADAGREDEDGPGTGLREDPEDGAGGREGAAEPAGDPDAGGDDAGSADGRDGADGEGAPSPDGEAGPADAGPADAASGSGEGGGRVDGTPVPADARPPA